MLDFIIQVQQKTWSIPTIVDRLIEAFNDIFQPQATLCSFGKDKRIDAPAFLEERLKSGILHGGC